MKKEIERKKNPLSLSYLDTLTKNELLEKKKEFEESIEEINTVFNQKDYDFFKKQKEKINEIKKAYRILEREFLKLNFIEKHRFFIKKGFFGGVSSASKVTYILCEKNNLTESVIEKLKTLIDLTSKHSSGSYNGRIEDFTLLLSSKHQIPITKKPHVFDNDYSYKVSHDFSSFYPFLNITTDVRNRIDSNNETSSKINISRFENYDKIFHPKKIYPHDDFWTTDSLEVNEDYFIEANLYKKQSYGSLGFTIGSFFEDFKKLNFNNNDLGYNSVQEVIKEETFKTWKSELIEYLEKYLRKVVLNLRSKERNKKLSENLNSVYILSNKSYENTYKVGWTSMLPEERAEQLSRETGVLYPFKVVYKKKFKDAEKTEKKIHKNFNKYRVKRNKEYFEINLDELKDYIDSI